MLSSSIALCFYYHQSHVSLDCDVNIFYLKLVNDAKPSNSDLCDEFKLVLSCCRWLGDLLFVLDCGLLKS